MSPSTARHRKSLASVSRWLGGAPRVNFGVVIVRIPDEEGASGSRTFKIPDSPFITPHFGFSVEHVMPELSLCDCSCPVVIQLERILELQH
mmetsp:Transcript_2933/g.5514  ORF Transcript_2933/g.5514 Transcript_2933/m.5514 type:complete len:91 (+) Transcript_2933:2081-2353(+)